jgi:hypothetical protein
MDHIVSKRFDRGLGWEGIRYLRFSETSRLWTRSIRHAARMPLEDAQHAVYQLKLEKFDDEDEDYRILLPEEVCILEVMGT